MSNGYDPVALYFPIMYKIASDRNSNRERFRQVPEFVIKNMAENLIPPNFEEKFKKILTKDPLSDKLILSVLKKREKGKTNN